MLNLSRRSADKKEMLVWFSGSFAVVRAKEQTHTHTYDRKRR